MLAGRKTSPPSGQTKRVVYEDQTFKLLALSPIFTKGTFTLISGLAWWWREMRLAGKGRRRLCSLKFVLNGFVCLNSSPKRMTRLENPYFSKPTRSSFLLIDLDRRALRKGNKW